MGGGAQLMLTYPPSYEAVLRESKHSLCFRFGNCMDFFALYCIVIYYAILYRTVF